MTPDQYSELSARIALLKARAISLSFRKGDDNTFIPPSSVRAAARRGLELREKWKRGGLSNSEASDQGIGSGVQRAVNLKNGDAISLATVKRMYAFFSRHQKNYRPDKKEPDGGPTAGTIAWALWGGNAGKAWASGIVGDVEKANAGYTPSTGFAPSDGKPEFMVYAKDGDGAPAGGPDASDVHVPTTQQDKSKNLKAKADKLLDRLEKAVNRWPAGSPNSTGGQFAPSNGGGGGVPARPDISRFRQDHPSVRRLHRRLDALQDYAARGDIDGIRGMPTSRGNGYDRTLDDHRTALLQHFEPAARAARLRASMPEKPNITGGNMENSALLSARRHADRLHSLATTAPDPVAALRDYQIGGGGRTNTYLRQAQSYHAALLAHFAAGETRAAVPPTPQQAPAPTARAPRPAAAPSPATPAPAVAVSASPRTPPGGKFSNPALRSVFNTTATINGRQVSVADVALSSVASNPRGMHPEDLGFVPRPNVPLTQRLTREGIVIGGRTEAFASREQQLLTHAYLAQPTSLQTRARDYQSGSYSPPRPLTPEERAAQEARQQAEEKAARQQIRAAAAAEEARRASIPDAFRPRGELGANVTGRAQVSFDRNQFSASVFSSKAEFTRFATRLISDYGGGTKFNVSASISGGSGSISYRGDDGTSIRRQFTANSDGTMDVYHAFFQAGSRGGGAGKRFFRVSMGEYIAAGVRNVDVTANIDVGGYAWARFGYLPKTQGDWDRLRERLMNSADNELRNSRITGTQHEEVMRILRDPDRRSLWRLSDFESNGKKIGKNLLLGTSWSGRIDTRNEEQMRRFTQYVGDRDD